MHTRTLAVWAVAAALLPAAPTHLHAQTGGTIINPGRNEDVSRVATRGASFLSLGVGGRALAMAGASGGTGTDLSAMYWNVAGISEVQSTTAFVSHEKLYGNSGLTNSFVGVAMPLFGGAAGLSVTSFSSGDIERTTEAWPEGNDPTFGALVRWTALSIGVHYSRPFTERLAVGATLKRASEGIQFASATYYGGDLGVRFRTGLLGSTLGVTVANLGTAASMSGPAVQRRLSPTTTPQFPTQRTLEIDIRPGQSQLPTMLRFALQTDLLGVPEALLRTGGPHRVSFFTDISDGVDTSIMPAVAAEYSFTDRFFLRAGGRLMNDSRDFESETKLAAGGGVMLPIAGRRFLLDYAWRRFGELNDNHVFSFQFGY
jgi:hypothetical protein